MPAPEINVRLSADGVQDVVNAFRRVQQEEKATKDSTTLLGQSFEQLGDLLPVISLGLVIEKTVEMGKQALESAVSIGKLAQETGSSAGTLSVLAMAAHDVGITQDELGTSLQRLSRSMENASNGNAQAQKSFQTLGISMADIKSKDPAAMFTEIAEKLQKMPDGATKSAVAMQLFGRSGAQLIPLLNEIGQSGGFEELTEKAKRFGLYLSDDFVAQVKQGEEALHDMEDVTQGLTLQFVAGFIPEATKGMTDLTKAVSGDGTTAFKTLGNFAGNVLRGITNEFLIFGQVTKAIWESMISGVSAWGKAIAAADDALLNRDFNGVTAAFKNAYASQGAAQFAIWSNLIKNVQSEAFGEPQTASTAKRPSGTAGGSGSGVSDEQARKLIEARSTFEDAVANAELQKQKERDAQAEAEDKSRYDSGLESLNEYYANRAARINAEADAEQAILQKKLDDEEAAAAKLMGKSVDFVKTIVAEGPAAVEAAAGANAQALAMLTKVEQTQAKIDSDELARQTKLQQNDDQRRQAQVQASQQLLADRQKLYELEGDTSAAQQLALQRELAQTEEMLIKLGIAESERESILGRVAANANAKNILGSQSQQGNDALTDLDTQVAAIQNKAAAGSISELDATAQIYKLEMLRLPNLIQIESAMEDTVDLAKLQLLSLTPGTDAYNAQLEVVNNLQKQVDQYAQKIDKLGSSLKTQTSLAVELSNVLATQGMAAFTTFFDDIATGQKSASQAFADLGMDFEKMIVHMIDQMIVYYTLMALVGWLAPGSSLATSLAKSGPFDSLTGHAAGGFTGNAPTNKVAGVVHGKEFVFNAAATSKWGIPLLEAMNAGTISSVATGSGTSSIGGGADSGDSSGPVVELNIDTGGQPAQTTQRQGSNGQTILDVVIGKVASSITGGGQVGQAIQNTYGVARKGQIRG